VRILNARKQRFSSFLNGVILIKKNISLHRQNLHIKVTCGGTSLLSSNGKGKSNRTLPGTE